MGGLFFLNIFTGNGDLLNQILSTISSKLNQHPPPPPTSSHVCVPNSYLIIKTVLLPHPGHT